MFKLNTSRDDTQWELDNAIVNCCSSLSTSDSSRAFNYRLVAFELNVYIFTETMVYIYNTRDQTVASAVQCSSSVCQIFSSTGGNSMGHPEWLIPDALGDWVLVEPPSPLAAETTLDHTGAEQLQFHCWPYTLTFPALALADVTASTISSTPGMALATSSYQQRLWHHSAVLNDMVYLLMCPASSTSSPMTLYSFSPASSTSWTRLSDAPLSACTDATSDSFGPLLTSGSSLYAVAAESSLCYLLTYASGSWAYTTLSDTAACCPGRSMAVLGDLVYSYGSSQTDGCPYTDLLTISISTALTSRVATSNGPLGRSRAAAAMHGQYLYLFGGDTTVSSTSYILHNDLYRLDITGQSWTELTASAAPGIRGSAHLLVQGDMLLLMGHDNRTATDPAVYILDLAETASSTLSWRSILGDSANLDPTTSTFAAAENSVYAYSAAGMFFSAETDHQIYVPVVSTRLIGSRVRASSTATTIKFAAGNYDFHRAVVLDNAAAAGITLVGASAGLTVFRFSEQAAACAAAALLNITGMSGLVVESIRFESCSRAAMTAPLVALSELAADQTCPVIVGCSFQQTESLQYAARVAPLSVTRTACAVNVTATTFERFGTGASWGVPAAEGQGGAVRIVFASVMLSDCKFRNTSAEDGGALYAAGSDVELTRCSFEGCTAEFAGGAVHALLSKLALVNTNFTRNQAGTAGVAAFLTKPYFYGGALFAESCSPAMKAGLLVSLSGCHFGSNGAGYRGGALAIRASQVSVEDSTFRSSQAAEGGALYAWEATFMVVRSTLDDNCAVVKGGAIMAHGNLTAALSASYLRSNLADPLGCVGSAREDFHDLDGLGMGGALYMDGGERSANGWNITSTEFAHNSAFKAGGMLAEACRLSSNAFCPSLELRGVKVINCSAGYAGGGLFWSWAPPNVTCTDGTVAAPPPAELACEDWSQNSVGQRAHTVDGQTVGFIPGYGANAASIPHSLSLSPPNMTDHSSGSVLAPAVTVKVIDSYQQVMTWDALLGEDNLVNISRGAQETASTMLLAGIVQAAVFNGTVAVSPNVTASQQVFHRMVVAAAQGQDPTEPMTATLGLTTRGCVTGEYLDGMMCAACSFGRYMNTSGTDATQWCPVCPEGSYSSLEAASTSCTSCPAGTMQPHTGRNSSADCQACLSSYISGDAFSSCVACPSGAEDVDRVRCRCSPGYTRAATSSSSISSEAQRLTGSASVAFTCSACPAGTYSSQYDSSACTECPAGTYNALAGQGSFTKCLSCSDGTYSAAGASSCSSCPAHAVDVSRLSCQCPSGFQRSDTGTASFTCQACPAGTYSASMDSYNCTSCRAGTYSASAAATSPEVCATCAEGTFSSAGAAACTQCPSQSEDVDRLACSCVHGYFVNSTAACVPCGGGRYSVSRNASECALCPAGTASPATTAVNSSTCVSCTGNTFSLEGDAYCTPCPEVAVPSTMKSTCMQVGRIDAGSEVTVYVHAGSGGSAVVRVLIEDQEQGGTARINGTATYTPIAPDNSLYSFGAAHTRPGSYNVLVFVDGVQLEQYSFKYKVEPAYADFGQSRVVAVSDNGTYTTCSADAVCSSVVAGVDGEFEVQLYDRYGNVKSELNASDLLQVAGQDIAVDIAGRYSFTRQGLRKGVHDAEVTLASGPSNSASGTVEILLFQVAPAAADALMTDVIDVARNVTCAAMTVCSWGIEAGAAAEYTVIIRDTYGNLLDDAKDSVVYAINLPANASVGTPQVTLTGAATAVDLATLTFSPTFTIAGDYSGTVEMNGAVVVESYGIWVTPSSAHANASYLAEGGVAVLVEEACSGAGAECAATPAGDVLLLSVVVLDRYSNRVDAALDAASQLAVKVDQEVLNGTTFTFNTVTSFHYRFEFVATISGAYQLSVSLDGDQLSNAPVAIQSLGSAACGAVALLDAVLEKKLNAR
ncbi:hypothetical protein CYMTET_5015 [Cymbomonas tetramitiformis]|uniref:Tyrosine-protein kinase ephrin type A/B receptor-like domain-containing protein n=1 Tax=Cymbomonas tetramitiformis TaxID=36881 RepID=A0AAE0H097_9CHLO|nr:hypothetical protein CYMTET_5015 [Cymbomonas tetramitiformis]